MRKCVSPTARTRGSKEVRKHITLSDPLQVKIVDALAEIAGIPNERQKAQIEIPERLVGSDFRSPVWDRISKDDAQAEKKE